MEVVRPRASSGAGARLVIGGPGGIGKTTVALAIFHSPDLDGCLPRARRFFVPCQSITTASTFLSTIASSLGVTISQGDALSLVVEKLKVDSTPLMLVLDNAESFWFDYEIRPHARAILQHICSVHTVTLLLTIRGTERPNVTNWDPLPLLGPLTLPHARRAFLTIATDLETDSSLDRLLKRVDYMPLAVSLLARRCQITGESATTLCNRWEEGRTELLNLGGREPDENIDISIKLSLDSPLVQSNPNTLRLLSIVSYLPAGISDETCSSMSLSDIELSTAEFLLRRLSLTYSPTPGWITMLEPVRAYMRRHNSPIPEDIGAVENWHVNLVNTHGWHEPGHAEFPIAAAKLAMHSANIAFILRTHIQRCKGLVAIVDPILAFSHFLYWTQPDGDLLEMLLSAGIDEFDHSTKAQCLHRLGEILRMRAQYESARLKLEEAYSGFVVVGDRLRAAQCLRSLGKILRVRTQYEEAWLRLEEARSEFTIIGDRRGAAQCLRGLVAVLRRQAQYEEARLKLEEAHSEFIIIGDRREAARSLQSFGNILGMQAQYGEARLKLEEAHSEFIIIGDRRGAARCLQHLGNILQMQVQYEEAQLTLEEAHSELIIVGDQLGAAQCLQSLGKVFRGQGDCIKARSTLEGARLEFTRLGLQPDAALCQQILDDFVGVHKE